MQVQVRSALFAASLLPTLLGCSRSADSPDQTSGKPASGVVHVCTVNYPLRFFAERIGEERVQVEFPAPAGVDPATWTPDAAAIATFQRAELILLNGASYAQWTDVVSLPGSKTVDTSASVSDRFITVDVAARHKHGPGGEDVRNQTASTVWLDPDLALAQAAAIHRALSNRRPQYAAEFQENFDALAADLSDLDAKLGKAVEGKNDRPLLFSRPVYQYLVRRYNLNARSLNWSPEREPTGNAWDELAELLEQQPAQCMIWENAPAMESAKRLEKLGVKSVVFDPCGNAPAGEDFLAVMLRNVENLAVALNSKQ